MSLLSHSGDEKESLINILRNLGEHSFVEGFVDNLDVDPYTDQTADSQYNELGGGGSPLSIYKYSKEALESIKSHLDSHASGLVHCQIIPMDTAVWQEGWKESFRPIFSNRFVVHPPWDKPNEGDHTSIEIDPGMAFGTGQHETTRLCLNALESLAASTDARDGFLDVGCGSGILGIGAFKLGYKSIYGRDIEDDSIRATLANAHRNNAKIDAAVGSFVQDGEDLKKFDLVMANILGPVLEVLFSDLCRSMKRERGHLIISGITTENEGVFVDLSREYGLTIVARSQMSDWVCYTFTNA